MSDPASDTKPCATSVTPDSWQGNNTPALSDLSERDKPWDKHKKNSDIVAGFYSTTREFKNYTERVNLCADLLCFRLAPDKYDGVYKLKLDTAKFCRVRTCPICSWRRSLRWKAKAIQVLPKIVSDYPNSRWLFVTLTVKNCEINNLRETLQWMHKGFKRLSELKCFPAVGWIKSVEVTKGRDGTAHPHFHCLMMVKSSYFKKGYISQKKWCQLWQDCLRIDYQPVLDIQAIKPHQSPTVLIPEILKYQTKESDLVADRDWFLELTRQLHKTRAIAVGGVFREYFKNTEREVEEDLIGKSEESDLVDEGHLYFGWKRWEKKYRMVNLD